MTHRLATALAFGLFATTGAAAQPTVVASILPLQSLAAAVMEGVGEPAVLLPAGASPHAYGLKPSDAALLEGADLVLWIGEELETFLSKPLTTLAGGRAVALADVEGVTRLPVRGGGAWDAHDHDHDHGHAHDHDHAHDGEVFDAHLWLGPDNAKAMTRAIAAVLAELDPGNAAQYTANAETTVARLTALEGELAATLEPVRATPFVVFHDAYQYFERAFGLNAVGSVTVSPEVQPGTAQVADLRRRIEDAGAVCVFAEPQFEPRLVSVLVEGTAARTGVLDPVGADLAPGPAAYPQLLRNLATALVDCLADG